MTDRLEELRAKWGNGLRDDVTAAFVEIEGEFERLLGAWSDSRPQPSFLYHFTDCAGLIGILKERSLWASLATALNDASETRYALETLSEELRVGGIRPTGIDANDIRGFCEVAVSQDDGPRTFAGDARANTGGNPFRAFVVSFSAETEAFHWLHYGRSGTGVALAFDAMPLSSLGEFQLHQVLYSIDDQRPLLSAIVEAVDRHARPFAEHQEIRSVFARLLVSYIRLVAPRIKSPAFTSENEWRLLSVQRQTTPEELKNAATHLETQFRPSNNRVIAYVQVPIPMSALRLIELGSSCPMETGEQALQVLVEDSLLPGDERVAIERSSVAVRP